MNQASLWVGVRNSSAGVHMPELSKALSVWQRRGVAGCGGANAGAAGAAGAADWSGVGGFCLPRCETTITGSSI